MDATTSSLGTRISCNPPKLITIHLTFYIIVLSVVLCVFNTYQDCFKETICDISCPDAALLQQFYVPELGFLVFNAIIFFIIGFKKYFLALKISCKKLLSLLLLIRVDDIIFYYYYTKRINFLFTYWMNSY